MEGTRAMFSNSFDVPGISHDEDWPSEITFGGSDVGMDAVLVEDQDPGPLDVQTTRRSSMDSVLSASGGRIRVSAEVLGEFDEAMPGVLVRRSKRDLWTLSPDGRHIEKLYSSEDEPLEDT